MAKKAIDTLERVALKLRRLGVRHRPVTALYTEVVEERDQLVKMTRGERR